MAIERLHQLHVALDLDGVVPLDVVKAEKHFPVINVQRPRGRVGELVTVEDCLPVLNCPQPWVVSEGPEGSLPRAFLKELGGAGGFIVVTNVNAMEATIGGLGG